MANLQIKKGAF